MYLGQTRGPLVPSLYARTPRRSLAGKGTRAALASLAWREEAFRIGRSEQVPGQLILYILASREGKL